MENIISKTASGNISSSQPPSLLSKKAQKRAGLDMMSKDSVGDNNDGDKDFEESVDSWRSQHLQRQVAALALRVDNGQFAAEERAVMAEERAVRTDEQVAKILMILNGMANPRQNSPVPYNEPPKTPNQTRNCNDDTIKGDLFGGEVFEHEEFVVPLLPEDEGQEVNSRTMLDGTLGMTDLMRIGSHGKFGYDARDKFHGEMSSIKKVNFPEARERENFAMKKKVEDFV